MAFFIRKSFSAGPVRLNLSKSGLGVSVGVTGARLGLTSRGRTYVHGGRGGLYYRRELSGSPSSSAGVAARGRSGPAVVVEEETDATFADRRSSANRPRLSTFPPKPNHHVLAAALGAPAAFLAVITIAAAALDNSANRSATGVLGVLALIGVVAWPLLLARQGLRATRGSGFGRRLDELLRGEFGRQELVKLTSETKASPEDIRYHSHVAYSALLDSVVSDGRVDDRELDRLRAMEEHFALGESFRSAARAAAFRSVYLGAVADHELEHGEEATLDHVRARLEIPDAEVADELSVIEKLKEVRRIREGDLSEVNTVIKLQRGESCHFEGRGRLLKRKTLRTFQQDGQRYKVEGLTVDKEGVLLITSKRLLLVHDGTSSIRHEKILDVELDLDRNLISIVKDGVQRPVLFSTPDAQRAAAVLAAAASL